VSFLARISTRVAGPGAPARAVMPKGLGRPQSTAAVRRRAVDAEEEAGLRPPEDIGEEQLPRIGNRESEEENQLDAVRRQEEEEEAPAQTLRRAGVQEEEGPIQTLLRQTEEEEEPIQSLLRQEEEEEAPVQTLRRRETEEEEASAVRPVRFISRAEEVPLEDTGQIVPPPNQENLEPDASPVSQELAGEEEPSDLQALLRELPSNSALPRPPAAPAPNARLENRPIPETVTPDSSFLSQQLNGMETPSAPPRPHGDEDRRPQVIIDQVDVLIHEPASSADRGASQRSHERAMRARYLRRL